MWGEIEGSGQRLIALWWVVMCKIMRISKQNRITSLADFHRLALRQERAHRRLRARDYDL
jgi:hypothetical protein